MITTSEKNIFGEKTTRIEINIKEDGQNFDKYVKKGNRLKITNGYVTACLFGKGACV